MKMLLQAVLVLLPWRLRRILLQRLYGYRLDPGSHVGLAWVYPRELTLERGASIGHLTVCRGMSRLQLGVGASIGRLNWITAYPADRREHFSHCIGRSPELVLGEHAAITNRHIVDCTARVSIGRYATIAGFRSQLLTHSIDLRECRQDARPIDIGEYCFVGTACTLLGGGVLPDYSVLGAGALLNSAFRESHRLYAGVPAKSVAAIARDIGYFHRAVGFVR